MPSSPLPTSSLLTSPLLQRCGIPHGFTTRQGGVSGGIFSSLNFGNPGDLPADQRDPVSNIRANQRLVMDALGVADREIVEVHQVHGCDVHAAARGGPTHAGPNDTRADALISDDPGRMLAIRVADCAPVLIADRDRPWVAAVHAGWRGVVGNIAARTVEAMRARGCAALVAAVGPCIGPEAFEVSEDVAQAFREVFGHATGHVRPGAAAGKSLVDLKGALREQLAAAGVDAVDVLPHCTIQTKTEYGGPMFYSHRGEHGRTGRMMALVGPRAE